MKFKLIAHLGSMLLACAAPAIVLPSGLLVRTDDCRALDLISLNPMPRGNTIQVKIP